MGSEFSPTARTVHIMAASFQSSRDTAGRDDLLRLNCGRLTTPNQAESQPVQDGRDMLDDYTIPIERKLWGNSLDSLVRSTYCRDRKIPDEVEVNIKLSEAGAGIGWLDTAKSPRQLLGGARADGSYVLSLYATKPRSWWRMGRQKRGVLCRGTQRTPRSSHLASSAWRRPSTRRPHVCKGL